MSAAVEAWEDALDATDRFDEFATLRDAIELLSKTRRVFSANDLPAHVRTKVNPQRVGRAFKAALDDGVIVKVAYTRSDKKCTHGKPVWTYQAAPVGVPEQPRDSDGRWTATGAQVDQLSIDEVLS